MTPAERRAEDRWCKRNFRELGAPALGFRHTDGECPSCGSPLMRDATGTAYHLGDARGKPAPRRADPQPWTEFCDAYEPPCS